MPLRAGNAVGRAGEGNGGGAGSSASASRRIDLRCATERERCVELAKLHHIARQVSLRQIEVNAGWVEARQCTQLSRSANVAEELPNRTSRAPVVPLRAAAAGKGGGRKAGRGGAVHCGSVTARPDLEDRPIAQLEVECPRVRAAHYWCARTMYAQHEWMCPPLPAR